METSRDSEQDFVTPPVVNGPSSDGFVRSTTDLGPAHFLLKIGSYSLLVKTGVELYESGMFEAGEHKWNLCFYPTGNSKSEGNGHISLYLKLAETESLLCGWKINAKLKFFVFDQLRKKYLAIQDYEQIMQMVIKGIRHFDKTNTEWGLARLLSLETFTNLSKGYLVNDCCILGAEVLVIKKPRRMECFSLVKKLFKFDSIYTWNIDNFSALDEEFYFSEGFTSLQGTVWRLLVYPKGLSSVYLHYDGGVPSNQKVYAEFKLRVKKQYANKRRLGKRKLAKQRSNLGNRRIIEYACNHWFCASSRNFGCCHLISLKYLQNGKGYVLNDKLLVEVEIVAMSRIKCSPPDVGTNYVNVFKLDIC